VITTITFDSYQGGQLAAKLLIKSGYERFGIITGPLIKWEANLRRDGYIDYLLKNGFHIVWEYHGDYSFRSGEKALDEKIISRELSSFKLDISAPFKTNCLMFSILYFLISSDL